MANSAFNPVAKATGGNLFHSDETVSGSVNGSNTAFTTQAPYVSATLEVYINGLRQARTTHVTETSPSAGTFTLDIAPLTGDIIRVNYQTTVAQTNAADTVDSFHASSTPTANKLVPLDANAKFNTELLNNPYKFRAYRSSNYSFAAGVNKVSLNAETFDTSNSFDSSSNFRYVAPVDGFYQFNGQVRCSCSNGNVFGPALYKNGSQYAIGDLIVVGTAFDQSFNISSLIQLTAGDYVELYFINGDAGSRTIIGTSSSTYLSGFLVSAI